MNCCLKVVIALGMTIATMWVGQPVKADEGRALPQVSTLCPSLGEKLFLYDGSNWEKCTEPAEADSRSWMLCSKTEKGIETETFRQVRTLLFGSSLNLAELCQIENSLIRSLNDCVVQKSNDIGMFIELSLRLSVNWARLGKINRAEQLYLLVYQLLNETDQPNIVIADVIRTLEGLANIQIEKHCYECAEKFAQLQANLARTWHDKDGGTIGSVVSALIFYAETLQKIGKKVEARKVKDEAASIRASNPCEGVCGDDSVR